jgi:hypothetical protein
MVTVFSPLPATRGRLAVLLAAASYRKVGEVKLGTVIGGGLKKGLKHNWKNQIPPDLAVLSVPDLMPLSIPDLAALSVPDLAILLIPDLAVLPIS